MHSYAEGLAALKAGKKIDYVGATGLITFNQYHNSTGGFEIAGYQPTTGTLNLVDSIPAASIAALPQVSARARAPAHGGPGVRSSPAGAPARKGARACSCTLSVSGSSPLR